MVIYLHITLFVADKLVENDLLNPNYFILRKNYF